MLFQKGDLVLIRKDSEFAYQIEETGGQPGVVRHDSDWSGWVGVNWPNGYSNSYHKRDLELISIRDTWKLGLDKTNYQ